MIQNILTALCCFVFVSCSQPRTLQSQKSDAAGAPQTLKEAYASYFPIGVSVSPWALKTDEARLILEQFNSMTAENDMKMGLLQPRENAYNWRDADSIAAFARRHGLKLRGHTLLWLYNPDQLSSARRKA